MTSNVKIGSQVLYCFKRDKGGELVERPAIVTAVNEAQQNVDLTVFYANNDQPGFMIGYPTAVGQAIEPIEHCWRFGNVDATDLAALESAPAANVTKGKPITKKKPKQK